MKSQTRIRLALAEGHWTLKEHDQALECLRRAQDAEPGEPAIEALADRFLGELEEGKAPAGLRAVLEGIKRAPEPASLPLLDPGPALETPTMAELLEQQGHPEKALEVAERALARNPGEARALAVRSRLSPAPPPHAGQIKVLQTWLDYFRAREGEEAQV